MPAPKQYNALACSPVHYRAIPCNQGHLLPGPLSGLSVTRATCHRGAKLMICPSVICFMFSEIAQLYDPVLHYLGTDLKVSGCSLWGHIFLLALPQVLEVFQLD